MARHYYIEGNNIFAEIGKLTEKELNEVKNYRTLGYELFDIVKVKEDKEPKEEWTKKAIDKFIKEKGTPEQQKKYKELIEKPAISKKTHQPITNKDGSVRKVGLVGAFSWFKEEFPEYPEV